MVIVWAIVIAVALLVEFLTVDFLTTWFAISGLASLILAACGVSIDIQVIVFFIGAAGLLFVFRPITKRLTAVPTTPTNADAEVGKITKLLSDVVEGKATIKINDITWRVSSEENLKTGDKVQITGYEGNRFIVKPAPSASS